ncbi:MAG: TROVE domain-containing protein [Bdellovibrionota bacterium]
MANKKLFQWVKEKLVPRADCVNEAGGVAYSLSPELALTQYALTGCLNQTFYASAETQLDRVLELCGKVDPSFVAKTAVYARRHGHMKDMPALLCAYLSVMAPELLQVVFSDVIDDAKMIRTFVQIMRSGQVARKSLGSLPKKLILQWLDSRSDDALFCGAIGSDPSLADVIKMVHPKPKTKARAALYGYLLGKPHDRSALSKLVQHYEAFKKNTKLAVPDVPFQLLTALPLEAEHWKQIAKHASWQTTRMNLNSFKRHGVFEDKKLVRLVADRLGDRTSIKKARVFPYQLLVAYRMTRGALPNEITEALQDAMEIATENVPVLQGKIAVFPDVSGSMQSAVTGTRQGSTSAVRCIDVAALLAACIVRKNRGAIVLPFENDVVPITLNPRDSVMTNAERLASIGGGGTSCSAPLARLNSRQVDVDMVVYVSDNQSWMDSRNGGGTQMMIEWKRLKERNPNARLVCIDIQPYAHSQAQSAPDVLHIGGFSDHVFDVMESFSSGELGSERLVRLIDEVPLRCGSLKVNAA